MDTLMLTRLLKTYGAPNTPQNLQAAADFFASNPEIAEKRAMGLRGSGIDDNSDVFRPILDKVMERTDKPDQVAQLIEQNQLPTQSNAPTAAPRPAASPSRQGNYGPATDTATKQGKDYGPGTEGGKGTSWLQELWPAILGATSVAGRKMILDAQGQGKAPTPEVNGRPPMVQPTPEGVYVGPIPRGDVEPSSPYMNEVRRIGQADPRGASAYTQQNGTKSGTMIPDQRANVDAFTREARSATSMKDIDILARKYGIPPDQAQQMLEAGQLDRLKLEDNISDLSRIKTNEPPPTRVDGDPGLTEQARQRQLQAEIDQENAMERIKAAEAERIRRNQEGTRATLNAARKNARIR